MKNTFAYWLQIIGWGTQSAGYYRLYALRKFTSHHVKWKITCIDLLLAKSNEYKIVKKRTSTLIFARCVCESWEWQQLHELQSVQNTFNQWFYCFLFVIRSKRVCENRNHCHVKCHDINSLAIILWTLTIHFELHEKKTQWQICAFNSLIETSKLWMRVKLK